MLARRGCGRVVLLGGSLQFVNADDKDHKTACAASVRVHDLEVFADYHQFYIWDAGVDPNAPDDYTDRDVAAMVKVSPSAVVVQPVRAMTVPVKIELHDTEPGYDANDWDHIAECSLDLPTGSFQVHECTGGPLLDLDLAPGTYRVRVLFAGLDALSDNGLEGDDRYVVTLWPGTALPLRVVKQWSPKS